MEIHEITEAFNVGAFASGAVDSYLKSTGAPDAALNSPETPYGGQTSIEKASAAAAPIIKQQAVEQQKLWAQAVNKEMAAQDVTAMNQLNPVTIDKMRLNLLQQVNKNFFQGKVGTDFNKLPGLVNKTQSNAARAITQRIRDAEDKIMDFSVANKTAQQSTAEWQELVQAAYEGMQLVQFYPSQKTAPSAATANNAAITAIGLTPQQLAKLGTMVKQQGGPAVKPTGNQAVDSILKAAKIIP
jgi:hypothetical protein